MKINHDLLELNNNILEVQNGSVERIPINTDPKAVQEQFGVRPFTNIKFPFSDVTIIGIYNNQLWLSRVNSNVLLQIGKGHLGAINLQLSENQSVSTLLIKSFIDLKEKYDFLDQHVQLDPLSPNFSLFLLRTHPDFRLRIGAIKDPSQTKALSNSDDKSIHPVELKFLLLNSWRHFPEMKSWCQQTVLWLLFVLYKKLLPIYEKDPLVLKLIELRRLQLTKMAKELNPTMNFIFSEEEIQSLRSAILRLLLEKTQDSYIIRHILKNPALFNGNITDKLISRYQELPFSGILDLCHYLKSSTQFVRSIEKHCLQLSSLYQWILSAPYSSTEQKREAQKELQWLDNMMQGNWGECFPSVKDQLTFCRTLLKENFVTEKNISPISTFMCNLAYACALNSTRQHIQENDSIVRLLLDYIHHAYHYRLISCLSIDLLIRFSNVLMLLHDDQKLDIEDRQLNEKDQSLLKNVTITYQIAVYHKICSCIPLFDYETERHPNFNILEIPFIDAVKDVVISPLVEKDEGDFLNRLQRFKHILSLRYYRLKALDIHYHDIHHWPTALLALLIAKCIDPMQSNQLLVPPLKNLGHKLYTDNVNWPPFFKLLFLDNDSTAILAEDFFAQAKKNIEEQRDYAFLYSDSDHNLQKLSIDDLQKIDTIYTGVLEVHQYVLESSSKEKMTALGFLEYFYRALLHSSIVGSGTGLQAHDNIYGVIPELNSWLEQLEPITRKKLMLLTDDQGKTFENIIKERFQRDSCTHVTSDIIRNFISVNCEQLANMKTAIFLTMEDYQFNENSQKVEIHKGKGYYIKLLEYLPNQKKLIPFPGCDFFADGVIETLLKDPTYHHAATESQVIQGLIYFKQFILHELIRLRTSKHLDYLQVKITAYQNLWIALESISSFFIQANPEHQMQCLQTVHQSINEISQLRENQLASGLILPGFFQLSIESPYATFLMHHHNLFFSLGIKIAKDENVQQLTNAPKVFDYKFLFDSILTQLTFMDYALD